MRCGAIFGNHNGDVICGARAVYLINDKDTFVGEVMTMELACEMAKSKLFAKGTVIIETDCRYAAYAVLTDDEYHKFYKDVKKYIHRILPIVEELDIKFSIIARESNTTTDTHVKTRLVSLKTEDVKKETTADTTATDGKKKDTENEEAKDGKKEAEDGKKKTTPERFEYYEFDVRGNTTGELYGP
jgi:hypothetical protein